MKEYIKKQLMESAEVKKEIAECHYDAIAEMAEQCIKTVADGGKILFCGNGGSAADSQHLAAELVVRLTGEHDRRALPAIALTTDTSILTACSNDFGFEQIFARQIEALGNPGDLLIAISTSGNSPNVLMAASVAKQKGLTVIAFTGADGGQLAKAADSAIIVPSKNVQRIQESHITIGHIIIGLIEKELSENG